MTAAPKRETIEITVAVVRLDNEPEPRLAVSLGEQTTALHFYDALRLAQALTNGCAELKKILAAKSSKAILQ